MHNRADAEHDEISYTSAKVARSDCMTTYNYRTQHLKITHILLHMHSNISCLFSIFFQYYRLFNIILYFLNFLFATKYISYYIY